MHAYTHMHACTKYPGINLDLYSEDFNKAPKKETKEDTRKWDYPPMHMDWENKHCENAHPTKSNLQIQCNLHQNVKQYFTVIENVMLKHIWKQTRQDSHPNPSGGNATLDFSFTSEPY